jgi:hypothetical protein
MVGGVRTVVVAPVAAVTAVAAVVVLVVVWCGGVLAVGSASGCLGPICCAFPGCRKGRCPLFWLILALLVRRRFFPSACPQVVGTALANQHCRR